MSTKPGVFQAVSIQDAIKPRTDGRKRSRPYLLRWSVDGRKRTRGYATLGPARQAQRELHKALEAGERWDPTTGYPARWADAPRGLTIAGFAVEWCVRCRPMWGAKTQDAHREALMNILVAACDVPPTGADRAAVRRWVSDACSAVPPTGPQTLAVEQAGDWLDAHSLELAALTPGVVHEVLLPRLVLKLNGNPVVPSTLAKRRSTLHALMGAAYVAGHIDANPVSDLPRAPAAKSGDEEAEAFGGVKTLPSPGEYREFVTAVASVGPQARRQAGYMLFSLYTGARPGEVSALRIGALTLPESGWGRATLTGSHTQATGRSGGVSRRGVKGRSAGTMRVVRLPPDLVAVLRAHVAQFPPGEGGYVFRNSGSGLLSSNQGRLYQKARVKLGWLPGHPFAGTTHYTARHVFISALIREGMNAVEIAKLCGSSPALILGTYSGVFEAMEEESLPKIAAALA